MFRLESGLRAICGLWKTMLLLSPLLAMAATAGPVSGELTKTLIWKMKLDASGHISSLETVGNSDKMLRDRLETDVRLWEFNPGTIDGKPAETETRLVVQVTLSPNADGATYAIRLRDVWTGGYLTQTSAPRVPADRMGPLFRSTLKKGGSVRVVMEVRFDGSGKTTSIAILADTTTTDAGFVHASRVAARKWRFHPEQVGGKGIPGRLVLLTCFEAHLKGADRLEGTDACQWQVPGRLGQIVEGQSLALDYSVHLKTDVIGRIL